MGEVAAAGGRVAAAAGAVGARHTTLLPGHRRGPDLAALWPALEGADPPYQWMCRTCCLYHLQDMAQVSTLTLATNALGSIRRYRTMCCCLYLRIPSLLHLTSVLTSV